MIIKLYKSLPYAYNKVGFLDGVPADITYSDCVSFEGIGTATPSIVLRSEENLTGIVAVTLSNMDGAGTKPYIVTNVTSVRNNLYRLDLRYAPIAFRTNLTGIQGVMMRSASKWDKTVPDNMMAMQQARHTYYLKFPQSFSRAQNAVIVIAGKSN